MRKMKRVLALTLVCALLFSAIPAEALATTIDTKSTLNMDLTSLDEITEMNDFGEVIEEALNDVDVEFVPIVENTAVESEAIDAVAEEQLDALSSETGNFTYSVTEDTVTITGYTGSDSAVVIPSDLDGYTVTAIGNDAFINNTILESIVIPDSVTTIGTYAFSGCSSLSAVTLSKGLVILGGCAFANCDALESIEIPKSLESTTNVYNNDGVWGYRYGVFYGCDGLKNVTFEEGTTQIVNGLFARCYGLESITIPDTVSTIESEAFLLCTRLKNATLSGSVTTIDTSAFNGCSALESIIIPDSVITLGTYAFSDCSSLTDVTLSKGLVTLGGCAFANCDALESIEIPKSLESTTNVYNNDGVWGYRYGVFYGCDGLKNVTFEEGTTQIVNGLFARCYGLESITIPDTVSTIESEAFYSADSLQMVRVPNSVIDISSNAFSNCPNVTFFCNYHSYATIFAIENNLQFYPAGTFEDKDEYILARDGCQYYADWDSMATNGYVRMTVSYRIKDAHQSETDNMELYILLPSNAILDEMTLKLDGSLCTEYEYDGDRTLKIPVTEARGEVKFYIEMIGQNMYSYAALTATENDESIKEIVGILNEKVNVLTLNAPETFGSDTVSVSGVAPASAEITVLVDGVEQTIVTTSRAGNWSADISINSPVEYADYTITAQCIVDGVTMEQNAKIEYRVGDPVLTGFVMSYNEHNIIKTCDFMDTYGTKPVVYFLPGTQFDFTVKFDNPETIDTVYVTSTRNQEKKYLETTYSEDLGVFVTNGYFDEKDTNYVPGKLNVEYTKKYETVDVTDEYNWGVFDEFTQSVSSDAVVIEHVSDSDILANIDFSSVSEDLKDVIVDASISVYDEATDGNLGDWLGVFKDLETFSSYVIPGQDDEKYLLSIDYSDPYSYVMLVRDASGSKFVKLALKTGIKNTDNLDTAWTLTQISGTLSTTNTIAGILLKQHEIETDMNELREEIWTTSYANDAQRQTALQMVDALEKDQMYFSLITTVLPLVVTAVGTAAVGATMGGPAILFTAILGFYTSMAPLCWQIRTNMIKSPSYVAKFAVDPSGYVYDSKTMERLEGVKVTAYCILEDESEGFWDNVPADDEYGTLWDASEYNQENPLYTNADGKYAWDVPTGWRVKYEKEGYETTWSDWLPVPPPQTEVNTGMTPITTGSGVTVSGTITSYNDSTGEVKVDLVDSTGTVAYWTTVTGNSASYTLSNVAVGTYTMNVSKVNHVTRSYTVVVEDADLTQDAKICLCGDVTGDGKITATDYSRLLAHVKKTNVITDEYTLLCADVTGEGKITATDYSRLLAHVKKVSLLW